MNRSTVIKVGNFVWFQTIWWLVILFQNDAVVPVMLLIMAWIAVSPKRFEDAKLMGTLFILGTIVDAALTNVGLFIFNETKVLLPGWPIPIWLSLLWAAFAGTVYHSMTMFQGRVLLAAAGGAIFAPLSYIAGAKFGAVELGLSMTWAYAAIAVVWSVVFPFSFFLSTKLERQTI